MRIFPDSVLSFYSKNLFRYTKGWALLYFVLSVFDTAGFSVIPAFFIKMVISTLESQPAPDALLNIIPVAIAYFAVRATLVTGAVMRWTVFDNCIKYKSYNRISADLYEYVFNQTAEYYTESMPGKINSQIDSIATGFYETFNMVFGNTAATVGAFILGLGGLFEIGWQYVLVIMSAVICRVGWGVWRIKHALNASAKTSKVLNSLHGRLLDTLSNFMAVKLFANADWEQKCAEPYRTEYEKTARTGHAQSRFFWAPGNYIMDVVGMTALIVLCGYMYANGKSSIADISFALSVFVGISSLSFNLIMEIKNFVEKWGRAVGSYNGLIKPISITDKPDATDLVVSNAVLEIKKLCFGYGKNNVLKNLSFSVAPGERVGIVGLSGAGKTTLVNLIMRLYDPTSGAIYINGQDIKSITQKSLHKNIAFIPQDSTMFNRTIRENIQYGRMDASEKEIIRAAKDAVADKFILSTPNKYDTRIGDRGIKLSGGQRQRVAIARAFLKNAPILILDEATSALDSETEKTIQESFTKLSAGRTTIVIAHRLSTLRNMDRLIVLDKGKIVESGNHKNLLHKDGIYARLWKMQSGGFLNE